MDSQVGKILNQIFLNEWRHVDEIRCEHEKSYDHDDHAYHAQNNKSPADDPDPRHWASRFITPADLA